MVEGHIGLAPTGATQAVKSVISDEQCPPRRRPPEPRMRQPRSRLLSKHMTVRAHPFRLNAD
eukprot:9493160-Pyramimonas_sp.AAC.1